MKPGFFLPLILVLTALLPSAGLGSDAPLGLASCESLYRAIPPAPAAPLAALRQTFPQIADPINLAARTGHPNASVPENKAGVEWLKSTLSGLKDNPDFRFKDRTSEFLFRRKRDQRIEQLLERLKVIESRGYPQSETIDVADEILEFMDRLDPELNMDLFLKHLESLPGLKGGKIDLPEATTRQIRDLAHRNYAEKVIDGEVRRRNRIAADEALIAALSAKLKELGSPINVREQLRKFEYGNAFQYDRDVDSYIVTNGLKIPAVQSNRVILLAPGEIPIRALAEAVLFNIEPAGLSSRHLLADGTVMDRNRFFAHDFNHMRLTRHDPLSGQLTTKSKEEKLGILRSIDAIEEPTRRVAAEYALMIALREHPSKLMDSDSANFGRKIALEIRSLGGPELSQDEAQWLARWWVEHLPSSIRNP